MDSLDLLEYTVSDHVALITMVAPDGRNSLDAVFVQELVNAIVAANEDERVGALLITGQDSAFSAGGDMAKTFLPKMRGAVPYDEDDRFTGGLSLLPLDWVQLLRDSKPIVVAFNGYAVGGGVTFFLPADVLVASENASFHFMFAKLGLVAEMCSTKYLPARVGFGRASEILLRARTVGAEEALSIGLIDHLFPRDTLVDEALAIAKSIAANPPTMLKLSKQLLDNNYLETDGDKVWQRESEALKLCFGLAEHKEAVNAFLEKRSPDFNNLEHL